MRKEIVHQTIWSLFTHLFVIGLFTASCSPPPPPPPLSQRGSQTGQLNNDEFYFSEKEIGSMSKFMRMEPADAYAEITKNISLETSNQFEEHEFPLIKIQGWETGQERSADYVQVLRCNADYQFQTPMGFILPSEDDDSISLEEKETAWQLAKDNERVCKIVTSYLNGPEFEDITADSSVDFYYAITPCISKARSKNRQDSCSYKISTSNILPPFVNPLEKNIRNQAFKVSEKEGEVRATLERLGFLSKFLAYRLHLCENAVAEQAATSAFYKGLFQLGIFVAGGLIGYNVMPFWALRGPNMAVMMGMMGSTMGYEGFIKNIKWGDDDTIETVLGLSPVQNTCMTGKTTGPRGESEEELLKDFDKRIKAVRNRVKKDDTEEDREEDIKDIEHEKKTFEKRISTVKKIQGRFKVTQILLEIEEIVHKPLKDSDGKEIGGAGKLLILTQELENEIKELLALKTNMMSTDQWLRSNNIDPNEIAAKIEAAAAQEMKKQQQQQYEE